MRRSRGQRNDRATDSDSPPSSNESLPPRRGQVRNGKERLKRNSRKGKGNVSYYDESDDGGNDFFKLRRGRALGGGPDSDFESPSSSIVSSEISFSQTTKINTARNGRTLVGSRLLNGNRDNRKQRDGSVRKKLGDRRFVDDDYESNSKKTKKKSSGDTDDDSTPPIRSRGRKKKNRGKVSSDTDESDSNAKVKPSYAQLVLQVGDSDSSNDCGAARVTSSTTVIQGNKPLAEIHLKGKPNRTIRVRRNLLSGQFSDDASSMDRCCRCGAGCDMVGEITGTLPACQYCLEELGMGVPEPMRRSRTLESMYPRGPCDPGVDEFGSFITCGNVSDQVPPCDFDVGPEAVYNVPFSQPGVLRRSASFYSRQPPLQEESLELPELVVRARVRKKPSRSRGFKGKPPRTLELPREIQRSLYSAKIRDRLEITDSQSQVLGDTGNSGCESDYGLPRSQGTRNARSKSSPYQGGNIHRDSKVRGRRFRGVQDTLPPEEATAEGPGLQRDFSNDTVTERSRVEEVTATQATEMVEDSETERIAREAWKRYARDYKRFQQNLAEWQYQQEMSRRRRLEDNEAGRMQRRPLAPPRPNCGMPDDFKEMRSRSGSAEDPKDNKDEDEGMRIRIAVSPKRKSRLMVNKAASWFPVPVPALGGDGRPALQIQGDQPLPIAGAIPSSRAARQGSPPHRVPGAQQLIYVMPKLPAGAAQPQAPSSPTAVTSPVMSPVISPTSANGSPTTVQAKVPPAGPPPPS